jgi:5,10-methylenetetrahydromethanopterin reductase
VTPKQVSIAFQTDKRADDYARLAEAAEGHGFDGVSVFADLGFQPPWQPLAVMARHTTRLRLGPACANPFTTHPIDIAGHAVTLDLIAGGRSYVGITKGTWLDQVHVRQRDVAAALVDSAEIVRRVVAGDTTGYEGDVFRLAAGFALRVPRERDHIPILIGAWGPRAVAAAGRVADELKVGGTSNPDLVAVMRARLQVGAAEVGRAATDIAMAFGAVTVVDEDGAAARRLARTEVAMYLAVLADLDPTVELPEELTAGIRDRVAAHDHEGAGALIPDEVLDRFAFAGTPDQIAAQACALFEAGLDRVEFGTPHGITPLHGVELLGTRVLPAVRAAFGG